MNRKMLNALLVLGPLVASFVFAMDVYVPDLPEIVRVFHASQTQVQMTLSVFMLALGIGQLFIGPLSDQVGRFKVALISTVLYTLTSMFCALSVSIQMLILGRVLQGLAGCGMSVAAFAATRDLFSGDEGARMYSLLNCCIGLSPLIAPILGGYLTVYFGWRAPFWFLVFLGLMATFLTVWRFEETHPPEKRVNMDLQLFKRYIAILLNRQFQAYAFLVFSGMSMFFVFFSFSPYIIIGLLKKPVQNFGYYFFAVGFMFFIGSYISAYLIKRVGIYRTAVCGVLITCLAGVLMWGLYAQQGVTVFNFIMPSMTLGIGGALIMGASAGGAMNPFPNFAGTAAAVLGFVEFIGSAIFGYLILHWKAQSTLPVAVAVIGLSALSLLMCLRLKVLNRSATV